MIDGADTDFVETKEHRRFSEFCDACRRHRYIGLCYGPPGVGKTLSARHYTSWDAMQAYADHALRSKTILRTIGKSTALFYTTPVVNSPGNLDREVKKWRDTLHALAALPVRERETARMERLLRRAEEVRDCKRNPQGYRGSEAIEAEAAFHAQRERLMRLKVPDPTNLLIIDEADRLKMGSLEQVRDIFDRGGIGLVLIGMPGIEKRLARYPQLYSRVGFVHEFRPLDEAETRRLLQGHWRSRQFGFPASALGDDGMAAILRVTGGNFRLMQRLLTQIVRVLEINKVRQISASVVEAARESLVIGMAA
jgi:DNA transposition AAA+ family ATPase